MLNVHSVVVFLLVHTYLISGETSDDLACNPDGTLRIVGGYKTTIDKHPWQVSFQKYGDHVCGGVIIAALYVLTAAHCIYKLQNINLYSVAAGETDLRFVEESIPVNCAIIHRKYDKYTDDYDIAALELKSAFKFSKVIQPIKLPNPSYDVPVGTILTTSGWGKTRAENIYQQSILREVQIPYIDRTLCKELLAPYRNVTERMVCAGDLKSAKDACKGDSGGPLQINGILIGTTSWGKGCGEKLPGVYANIRYLRPWIRDITGV